MTGSVVIIGGTAGLGREIAAHYAAAGRDVVLTGRDAGRAETVAAAMGPNVRGAALDLAVPSGIANAVAGIGSVEHLVLAAIDPDANAVASYDMVAAIHLTTMKLVGYTETVHALTDRLTGTGSILMFGGMARIRPYAGSTTVSTINAGIVGMVRTLSVELAPTRVNSIHPGIVGDSPFWARQSLDAMVAGTLTGRLATMADTVHAAAFLLDNASINGVDLVVDGGWR